MFHLTLVRTKLENVSTVSNSVPSDKAKNLKRISAEVRRPLSKPFLTYDHVSYRKCSKLLKFHTLHNRGVYFDLLFISFYSDFAAKHLCKDVDILSNTFKGILRYYFFTFSYKFTRLFSGLGSLLQCFLCCFFLSIFLLFSLFTAFVYICTALVFFCYLYDRHLCC